MTCDSTLNYSVTTYISQTAILLSVCACNVPNKKYFKMILFHKKISFCHQVSGTKLDCGTDQIEKRSDVRETFCKHIPLRQNDLWTKMIGI